MPEGSRRLHNSTLVSTMIDVELRSRVLPFTGLAAVEFAEVFTVRRKLRLHRATVATRNTRDFEYAGVEIINPWQSEF
jgi:predicted nucleic acid-binding protein